MFYDIKNFPFLEKIRSNVELLAKEFEFQSKKPLLEGFLDFDPSMTFEDAPNHVAYWIKETGIHPDQLGYDLRDGELQMFPLFKKGFPIKWYDISKEFPETIKNIESVPNANFSGYFRLGPNSGSKEHVHSKHNLVFHLVLADMDAPSVMRCQGEEKVLQKKGDYCIFDYALPHSSYNFSTRNRVNLMIDFTPDEQLLQH